MEAKRLSIAIDLKKNRIRIHKATLHALGEPKRVQLLFNPEKRALMISCPSKPIPESQDEKVYFDKPGNDGTCQLYSRELLKRIRAVCPELENHTLYHIRGKYVTAMNAAYFRMDDCVRADRAGEKDGTAEN